MSAQVGISAQDLANGMYLVESAGYHGAAGLTVMKMAAEGARADGADMTTMANALTTALNAYHAPASQAASYTNQMVAAVAAGKMNMEDFAGSLSAVLPVAAAAHISFAEVAGAIATMTAQGMSAQQATQDYANTIRSLQNPNSVAITEMQQLGLNSNQVADQLGSKGLTGTLLELTQAITAHMGPAGDVILTTFKNSQQAAANVKTEIDAMPASLQKLAQGFLDGSINAKAWRTDLQTLPPAQQHIMQQFATTADKLHEFNSQLTSGSPEAQTYTAALSKMLGGSTGLNTALMLTGGNMKTFQGNVDSVADAGRKGGANIAEWGHVQGEFNVQMDQAKTAIGAAGIALGMGLLPYVSQVMSAVTPLITGLAEWTSHHQQLAAIITGSLGVIGALVAVGVVLSTVIEAIRAATLLQVAAMGIAKVATAAWSVAQWLLNIALAANPIGLVVIAIALLVAGVVLAYQHIGWFRDAVNDAWAGVQRFGGWLKDNLLPVLQDVGNFISGVANGLHNLTAAASNIPVVGGIGQALGLPGFAAGGPIPAGQVAIVGEQGPELFVSGQSGTIVPNGQFTTAPSSASGGAMDDTNDRLDAMTEVLKDIYYVLSRGGQSYPGGSGSSVDARLSRLLTSS
jgi:hypothetical protein